MLIGAGIGLIMIVMLSTYQHHQQIQGNDKEPTATPWEANR
jgi:hypothetical protein